MKIVLRGQRSELDVICIDAGYRAVVRTPLVTTPDKPISTATTAAGAMAIHQDRQRYDAIAHNKQWG